MLLICRLDFVEVELTSEVTERLKSPDDISFFRCNDWLNELINDPNYDDQKVAIISRCETTKSQDKEYYGHG